MVLEPLREKAQTALESCVGATTMRWEGPQEHEATTVPKLLQEEALTAVRERQLRELKDEHEPLWEEATMAASAMRERALAQCAVWFPQRTGLMFFPSCGVWRITLPVL